MTADRDLLVHLRPGADRARAGAWTYDVAGQRIRTDRPVELLDPWRAGTVSVGPPDRVPDLPADEAAGQLIHSGSGLIADAWRDVACHRTPAGYRLVVGGVGSFHVGGSGEAVALLGAESDVPRQTIEEVLVGPVLILALALRGTWCLHGAAVAWDGAGAAFVGESGHGKSTLAACFAGQGAFLADDILPVAADADGDGVIARPRFPQLKVAPERQSPDLVPARVPLRAVYVLAQGMEGEDGPATIEPISGPEAVLALVRHTVAARLFDDGLASRHLAFCARAALCVAVRRLAYARRWDVLPDVRAAVVADLESLARA